MFSRILVPVDFSPKNERAMATAREMARGKPGGRVTLLHVIEPVEGEWDKELEGFYEKLESRAAGEMTRLMEFLGDGEFEGESVIVVGNRLKEIVQRAAAYDLVILSSHPISLDDPQRGGLTVSYRAAILAPCPVLLVK